MFAGAVLIMRGYCCNVLCRVARQRQVGQDAGLAFFVIDESQPDGHLRRQGWVQTLSEREIGCLLANLAVAQ